MPSCHHGTAIKQAPRRGPGQSGQSHAGPSAAPGAVPMIAAHARSLAAMETRHRRRPLILVSPTSPLPGRQLINTRNPQTAGA